MLKIGGGENIKIGFGCQWRRRRQEQWQWQCRWRFYGVVHILGVEPYVLSFEYVWGVFPRQEGTLKIAQTCFFFRERRVDWRVQTNMLRVDRLTLVTV